MKKRNLRYMTEEWRKNQSEISKNTAKKHVIEVTCDRCGEIYRTYDYVYARQSEHYCPRCRGFFHNIKVREKLGLHMYKHKCIVCGKEYESTRKNIKYGYCSEKCRKIGITRVCQTCGKKFVTDRPDAKYCSKECFYKSKDYDTFRYGYAGKEIKGTEENKCPVCGKPTKPNKTYCSLECSRKARAKKVKYCTVCGKPMPSGNKRYCSLECQERDLEQKRIDKGFYDD